MAKIDREAFRSHEVSGYITGRAHPIHDLIIWNYTPKCQFEHIWDEITLQARGLITTPDGTVVARPFKKFFNLEEYQEPIPLEPFKVTEKMDGSLGILYFADGKPYIATRGSFTSEQALKANEILYSKYADFLPTLKQWPYYTFLFEIVYKANRIVIDYGEMEDLILLAIVNHETGEERDVHSPAWCEMWPFPLVKEYDGITDIGTLKALEKVNHEGFVIRFESGLRLKVKFEEYKRLHRILTQCTTRTIWELLKSGESFDEFIERVPDEFNDWVKKTRASLQTRYNEIEQDARHVVDQVSELPTRKEQAASILKRDYSGVVFAMLDNKSYAEAIWKMIKPQAEKPFREDEEG